MKRTHLTLYIVIALIALLSACGPDKNAYKPIDPADMDPTTAPGDNFYQYTNGGWLARTEIPEDRTRFGAFDILQEQTEEKVKDILFRAMERKGDTLDAEWVKIGDFFASGMDTARIQEIGLAPVQADIDIISTIASPDDIVREFARQRAIGGSDPFYVSVEQDSKEATSLLLSFYQSGLGMPERDYYFDQDENSEKLRVAYKKMLADLFVLLGRNQENASSIANDIFTLETALAEASFSRLQYRDPHLTYNKLTPEALQKITPNINWNLYFQNLGIDTPETLLLDNPKFFTTVSNLLTDTPVNIWKDYLTAHFLLAYSSCLNQQLEDIYFAFYGQALSGQQVQQPRWKRVMRKCQQGLGEAIGKVYVKENFPPEAKQRMVQLVENLRTTYRERIADLTWMSDETKAKAQEKLDAMVVKIGYPENWKDYSDLFIARDSYAMNVRNSYTHAFNYTMSKLNKPLDRTEWFMTPQTVNAYYNPPMNEIVFPAAILQPPFFSFSADDAVNYGGIGVVIGHEITHGFDDQGRKFNKEGNLENWWTDEDSTRFAQYTKLLVDQYNGFEAVDGQHVNGELTLGENLADYGGLTIAVNALKRTLDDANANQTQQKIDGFTPLQRFFIAYSKLWRNKIRKEELLRRLKNDVHSPGEFRVNGAVYNIDEFYNAFEVANTSPFYRTPEQRPTIW